MDKVEPMIVKQSYEQDLPQGRIMRSKQERSLVQYPTTKQQRKVERDAFEWLLQSLQILKTRLKYFYSEHGQYIVN